MEKKTHRDEGHPQDSDGCNDGAQPAKIEGPRLEVLCIEEPHCNGDGICSRSTEWASDFWQYHCKRDEENSRLWVELFRLLSRLGCLGAIRAWQCSGDLAELRAQSSAGLWRLSDHCASNFLAEFAQCARQLEGKTDRAIGK